VINLSIGAKLIDASEGGCAEPRESVGHRGDVGWVDRARGSKRVMEATSVGGSVRSTLVALRGAKPVAMRNDHLLPEGLGGRDCRDGIGDARRWPGRGPDSAVPGDSQGAGRP
jgi:hypothetical protein